MDKKNLKTDLESEKIFFKFNETFKKIKIINFSYSFFSKDLEKFQSKRIDLILNTLILKNLYPDFDITIDLYVFSRSIFPSSHNFKIAMAVKVLEVEAI